MRCSLLLTGALMLTAAKILQASGPAAGPYGPDHGALTPPVIGVVRDSAGAPIGEVNVVIPALNRTTVTNDSGRFTFTGLPAGTYHLTALMIGRTPGHADVTVPESGPPVYVMITMGTRRSVRLTTVQVTATPTGTDPRDVAQATSEISGSDLARGLGPTIAATLANEAGVAVRFNGPAAAPVIRGLSGERVLVLQDGQRAGDLAATSADHAVSVEPLTAQRIEVVRGPASLLYGNNALGGVVNVISNDLPTDLPSHVDGYVNTQGESASPGGAVAAGITVPVTPTLAVVARGAGRYGDDLRMGGSAVLQNTFTRSISGSAGLAFVGQTATSGLIGRRYTFGYGLPSPDNDGVRIEGDRYEAATRSELARPLGPLSSVRLSATAQWYGHDEIEPTGEIGTRLELRTQTFDVLGRTHVGPATGAIGVSGLFRQYAATGSEALTPGAANNGLGFFLFQEIPMRQVADAEARVPRLQVGARYDYYGIRSRAGDPKFGAARTLRFDNVSGSIGLNVPFTAGLTVAVSAARAFRAPTVEELFSHGFHAAVGTYDVGNPDLDVETNQGVDAIMRYATRRANIELAGYANRIANYIAPNIVGDTVIVDPESGDTDIVPLNRFRQDDAKLRGVEGRAEYEVVRRVVAGVVGDLVRGDFQDGSPLPFLPAARLGALARYDDGAWSFTSEYRHGFAQRRVPAAIVSDDPAAIATAAYDLVNASIGFTVAPAGHITSIMLRADNLLDERYRDAASRIKNFASNPGRNLAVVVRTTF